MWISNSFYVSNTGEVSASPYQSDPSELVSQLNYTSQGDFYLQAGFRVIKVDLENRGCGGKSWKAACRPPTTELPAAGCMP